MTDLFKTFLLLSLLVFTGCKKEVKVTYDTALFGGGCFWTLDYYFQKVDGVIECNCVYSSMNSEAVLLKYDKSKVSFKKLCEIFFELHDSNKDFKPKYISLIQTNEKIDLEYAEKLVKEKRYGSLITELGPTKNPEEFHEDWHKNKNSIPRCNANMEKLKDFFK